MSKLIKTLCTVGVLGLAVSLAPVRAQTTVSPASNTTRAEQKQDLKTLEQNGYDPAKSANTTYPSNLQAAEQKAYGGQNTANAGMAPNAHPVTGTSPNTGATGQPANSGNH